MGGEQKTWEARTGLTCERHQKKLEGGKAKLYQDPGRRFDWFGPNVKLGFSETVGKA